MKDKAKQLLGKIKKKINLKPRAAEVHTIAVCGAQVPFNRGGAEEHVDSLTRELKIRGYEADVINIPFKWYPHQQLFNSIDIWESLDLSEADGKKIDMVIATKFPSYFVQHPNKVLWLIHQYRQAYDLLDKPFSGFDLKHPGDVKTLEQLRKRDTAALSQYRRIYTNAANTSMRLKKFNNIDSIPLYHPPKFKGRYYHAQYGDYILSLGRLDPLKRVDLLIKGLKHADPRITCKIAGKGAEMESLKKLTRQYRLENRIQFLGYVNDDELLQLYANCAFVFFAPYDEDYGYITLEAFLSKKAVITAFDSGGPLEFVKENITGIILNSLDERYIGQTLNQLFFDRERCRTLGNNGYAAVADIHWDHVINTLLDK